MLSNTKAQSSLEPKWALYSFLVCLLFVDQFTRHRAVFLLKGTSDQRCRVWDHSHYFPIFSSCFFTLSNEVEPSEILEAMQAFGDIFS